MRGLIKTFTGPVALGVLGLALALPGISTSAFAQTGPKATKIGKHSAWGTYSFTQDSTKVCYVLTVPTDKQPPSLNHGDMFFFVSQKPGQNVSFEPQFIAGYTFKEASKVTVSIGSKSFSMFTRGSSAWMENAAEEPALVAAMKGGTDMKVAATSGRGNPTSYVFSLKGISAALDSISSCK